MISLCVAYRVNYIYCQLKKIVRFVAWPGFRIRTRIRHYISPILTMAEDDKFIQVHTTFSSSNKMSVYWVGGYVGTRSQNKPFNEITFFQLQCDFCTGLGKRAMGIQRS